MQKSENINELATALSKLQGKITDAHKDRKGFNYSYADLSAVLDIARPLLSEFGLSVSQLCSTSDFGTTAANEPTQTIKVETVLLHSSGQYISGELDMLVQPMRGMTTAQAAGSVITYARRYSLAALLGIAQVDSDAAVDQKAANSELKSVVTKKTTAQPEHKVLFELLDKVKVAPTEQSRWLAHYKVTSFAQLNAQQAGKLVEALNEKLTAQEGAKKNGV